MRRCRRCGRYREIAAFSRQTKAPDGLHTWCKTCTAEYVRAWREAHPDKGAEYAARVKTDPKRRLANSVRSAKRHPERVAARKAVHAAVRRGVLPSARDCTCADCGEVARCYDHHEGYDVDHRLDVQPVCFRCHGRRSRARGEHATSGPPRKWVEP